MPTTPGFFLEWDQGSSTLVGIVDKVFQEQEAVAGISFPSNSTIPITVSLSSSARSLQTFDNLINTKLYLTGDPEQIQNIQTIWPTQNGGLYISYDGGKTYNVFSTTYGYESIPSTWPIVPAVSIGLDAEDGFIGPYASANFVLQYIIPPQATQYQIYDIYLGVSFDVA